MYSFIILGLLCCILRTGNAITCSQCLTVSSTNDEALNLTSVPAASCSESECLEDVTSCMTMTFHVYLQHTGEEVITMTQKQRGCTLPGFFVPPGDVCLDQDQMETITRTLPDPSSLVPWHLNVTVLGSNISICVCNSSDSCIPPSPVPGVTEPTPGRPRVCIECKEITSDVDMDFIDTELVSCSDSPGEMVCPVGVSSCMAGIINVAYRLESGETVTLVDERHACTPEDIASTISSGDYCIDQALVDAYLAVNDPAELYPDGDGMTFDRVLNATFCVCDSADHCIPPFSSMKNGETGPNTGDANDGGSKNDEANTEEATGRATDRSAKTTTPKSSALDLGATIVLVITSPISAFLISFMEFY